MTTTPKRRGRPPKSPPVPPAPPMDGPEALDCLIDRARGVQLVADGQAAEALAKAVRQAPATAFPVALAELVERAKHVTPAQIAAYHEARLRLDEAREAYVRAMEPIVAALYTYR